MGLAPFLGTLFSFFLLLLFFYLISYSTNPEVTKWGHLTYFIRKKKVVKINLLMGFFYNFLNLLFIFLRN